MEAVQNFETAWLWSHSMKFESQNIEYLRQKSIWIKFTF